MQEIIANQFLTRLLSLFSRALQCWSALGFLFRVSALLCAPQYSTEHSMLSSKALAMCAHSLLYIAYSVQFRAQVGWFRSILTSCLVTATFCLPLTPDQCLSPAMTCSACPPNISKSFCNFLPPVNAVWHWQVHQLYEKLNISTKGPQYSQQAKPGLCYPYCPLSYCYKTLHYQLNWYHWAQYAALKLMLSILSCSSSNDVTENRVKFL